MYSDLRFAKSLYIGCFNVIFFTFFMYYVYHGFYFMKVYGILRLKKVRI